MVRVGVHVSSSKSIDLVFDRAKSLEATTAQFFVRSPRAWKWTERSNQEKEAFRKKKYMPVVVHASYLFNLASDDEELRKKSIQGVIEELQLCEELGIEYYVIHAGKTKGRPEKEGIQMVIKAMEEIFSNVKLKNTTFLYETLAGQKGELGKTTEEIYQMMEPFLKEKIGVCLDTCHLFAAGYKIDEDEGFYNYKKELDKIIGLEYVKVIHTNDSKVPFNSHKDRHESIGKGFINMRCFELFLHDDYFSKCLFVLETPDESLYKQEIKLLKDIAEKSASVAQRG